MAVPVITSDGGGASANLSVRETLTAVTTVVATGAPPAITYSIADVTSNLVAHWKLDETSGTTATDSSGSGYDGTYVNSPTLNQTGAFGTSKAVTFASASSQAVSAGSINLSATSAITVAAWVKTSATSGVFVEGSVNMNTHTDGFYLGIGASNTIEATHKGNTGHNQVLYSTTLNGNWKHVVAIYDKSQPAANEIALYIDGSFATYTNGLSNNNTNSFGNRPVYLASRAATSSFLSGTLDDVRIYSRALSATDIKGLYNSGLDSAKFSIVGATGVLTFGSAPNYETPLDFDGDNVYVVTVAATNSDGSDTQTISVTVTDAPAPAITSLGGGDTAAFSMPEGVLDVTTVVASGAPPAITYSVTSGDDAAKFSINSSTGALTFNPAEFAAGAPDYESAEDDDTNNIYSVTVQAANSEGSDTQDLTITITDDLADNTPDEHYGINSPAPTNWPTLYE